MIGKLIRAYRETQCLSTREFSKLIGISYATLNRIERGHPMDGKTMVVIFRWLFEENK